MDIISVSNQKGGVSKTGVSFNLGTALALKRNKKVLLIDLDPQANLSEYLKYEPDGKPTLTQLVMTACTGGRLTPELVASAIRHNDTAGVDYTDTQTVRHINPKTNQTERYVFHTDHIRYYLHHIEEMRPELLQEIVDKGEIYKHLDELDTKVTDTVNRQTELLMQSSRDYQAAVMSGRIDQSGAIGNLLRIAGINKNRGKRYIKLT